MKRPPPPPPVPASGGEPQAIREVVSTAAAVCEPPSPPEHDPESVAKMLGFVNEIRRIRGLGEIDALPPSRGTLAAHQPLSLALGCSVIKHRAGGPFYGLVYKKAVLDAFITVGCHTMSSVPRIMSDEKTMMWEVVLPAYLKPFA